MKPLQNVSFCPSTFLWLLCQSFVGFTFCLRLTLLVFTYPQPRWQVTHGHLIGSTTPKNDPRTKISPLSAINVTQVIDIKHHFLFSDERFPETRLQSLENLELPKDLNKTKGNRYYSLILFYFFSLLCWTIFLSFLTENAKKSHKTATFSLSELIYTDYAMHVQSRLN